MSVEGKQINYAHLITYAFWVSDYIDSKGLEYDIVEYSLNYKWITGDIFILISALLI